MVKTLQKSSKLWGYNSDKISCSHGVNILIREDKEKFCLHWVYFMGLVTKIYRNKIISFDNTCCRMNELGCQGSSFFSLNLGLLICKNEDWLTCCLSSPLASTF